MLSRNRFPGGDGGLHPWNPPRRPSLSLREPAAVLAYALRRLAMTIPTLFVIITVAFFMMRMAPGCPFDSDRALPPEIEKNIMAAYGLEIGSASCRERVCQYV